MLSFEFKEQTAVVDLHGFRFGVEAGPQGGVVSVELIGGQDACVGNGDIGIGATREEALKIAKVLKSRGFRVEVSHRPHPPILKLVRRSA